MNFGQFLRAMRQDRGIELLDLAKKTGMAPTNLQRMESGERPPPAEAKIALLSVSLGMDKRSTQVLLFLAKQEMPEVLVHLALTERELPIEDFFTASLMRWVHVTAEDLGRATWLRVVHLVTHAREGAEREMSLTIKGGT